MISNSYALEALGWRGLCIEPNKIYHVRYAEVRRRCELVPFAISEGRGNVPFAVPSTAPFSVTGVSTEKLAGMLGGIVAPGLDNAYAKRKDIFHVQAIPFSEVLHNYSVPHKISYLRSACAPTHHQQVEASLATSQLISS